MHVAVGNSGHPTGGLLHAVRQQAQHSQQDSFYWTREAAYQVLCGSPKSNGRGLQRAKTPRRSILAPATTNGSRASPADNGVPRTTSSLVQSATQAASHEFGFPRNFDQLYVLGKELAKGGCGVVSIVVERQSGEQYACKSIPKHLPGADEDKHTRRWDAIHREVEVQQRLRGVLNVVELARVFEDDEFVHIVMELCTGGELYHNIGQRAYSERTVASFMRAILRTIAQCHANNIIHRDIKPGNFMLLDEADRSPLKAIDFGLALPFTDKNLPITNAELQGTPWFMAPEQLSSRITPAIDVWAAGVTAHQLLTGRFPFDDKRNPLNPALSAVWRSILTDQLSFKRSYWEGISPEAKDFVQSLLQKDPEKRPSAMEALEHPWLRGGIRERGEGKALELQVVAKLQRFAVASQLKRSILQHMAKELVTVLQARARTCPLDECGRPVVQTPEDDVMQYVYQAMALEGREVLSTQDLVDGLKKLGYHVSHVEVERLLRVLDPGRPGELPAVDFAASQIDWAHVQTTYKDTWLGLARKAFEEMDVDKTGFLTWQQLLYALKLKVDSSEMHSAVKQCLAEVGDPPDTPSIDPATGGLDFEAFCSMLRITPSKGDLRLYDDRDGYAGSASSCGQLSAMLERSAHGGDLALGALNSVREQGV